MIVCVLTENEIAPLYRYVATSMNESIKSGKKYNPDQVMKRLYTTMSKIESKDPQDIKDAKYHAANFVQYVPALMIDLAMDDDYRSNLNIDSAKIGELYGMYTDFRSENGLNVIIDKFSKKRNTASLKADINTKKENKNKPVQKEPEIETPTYDEVRYKPYSSLKGTMQEYVAVDPTKKKLIKPEQRDKNRANIVNTLRSIENQLSVSDDGLTVFEYEGKELALKAMPLLTFYKNYEKFVDPTTKANITRTAGIISRGGQLADVTTPDQQVVIILTDNNGQILYFDQEGNITTEDSPNAAIVYQFLHDVRKTKDGYTVTDIYNKENKILSPEQIAESTYIKELDGEYNTYLEKVKKGQKEEFEALYNFKEEVLNIGEQRLEFTGISRGMSSDLTNKTIDFDLLKSLGVTRKDFKTIETLKKAERGLPKGAAVMTINGRKFQVDRVNVSNDTVDQIAEVLFNKNLTYMQRLNFLNQFIPSGSQMADSVRRHEWNYKRDTEFMVFKSYQYTVNDKWNFQRDIPVETIKKRLQPGQTLNSYLRSLEQDGKYKFFVVDSGKTVKQFDNTNIGRGEIEQIDLSQKAINNYTEAYVKEAKEKIKDSLKRGWKEVLTGNYNPTKLSFNEELLADGEYLVYDTSTGKFIKKDYLDFVMSLDTSVTIKTEDPGIYNNYINFNIVKTQSTRVSKKEVIPTPIGDSLVRQKQKEVVRAIKESPYESLLATVISFRETQQKDGSSLYTLNINIEDQEGEFTVYRAKNKPVIGEIFNLELEDLKSEDGKTVWPNTVRGIKYDEGYNLDFGVLAATDFSINEEPIKGIPVETYEASKVEIVAKTTVPGAEVPENTNTNASKLLRDDDDLVGLERAGEFTKDNILTFRKKAKQAKTWWNESETGKVLSKYIELDHAANIVNSNVFADFVVAGANLLSVDKLGKIRISALRGSFIDVYHESFHVFTQLFLTKDQKVKLYEEVRNYKDANGKSPYADMSYFEIEEMLAEDFRTYAKNQKPQKDTPVKNTLFRRMLNFLKGLFNGASKVLPTIKRDIVVDSSSVPVVGELFENLYFNNNNFLNNYKPSIENVAFNQLERGVTRVANSRDQILSETDSDTMVSAIDSIISEEIDELHDRRKSAGQVNLKSGVLGMLTNDTNRTKVYGWVKERLEEKLQSYKDKLYSQPGITKFSDFKTLEQIKTNAVGILEAVEGEQPKYIFLKSQIDTFNDLIPDIKKGRRVKGDLYYDIRIVADFYRHAALKDGKNTVDIMVVSKLEDAEVQLNNYIKGKAKIYTNVTIKSDVAAEELNQEQEFILDNIRILETALSEFGDPLYWQKGEEPKGLIKYHLENSEFGPIRETLVNVEFEGQDDYDDMIEDENGNDIFPEEQEGKSSDSDLTNDGKVGKYSLLQLAEPRTIYILKSLFAKDANDQFELDRFGFKKLANFKQTWNTVAKVVGGTQNISEIHSKLLRASTTYPILKQLIEYKLPNASEDITNSFEADNIISFWQTFRKPRVPYIQTIFYPIYGTTVNPINGATETSIKGYTSKVIYASTDFAKVIRAFKNEFDKSEATSYIEKINNKSYLNLPAILKKFKISNEVNELDTAMAFDFANAVGFYLDDTPEIRKALEENTTFYGLQYIFDIIKDVEAIQARIEDPNQNVATEAIEFLNRFRSNPIGTLAGKMPAQLLPSVKSTKKDITEQNVVNRLADLQAKSGYAALNLGVRNAAGNTVFENIEVHSMYAQVDSLNEMSTLADAWESDDFQHMSYLDDTKNTLVKRSALLNSLFKIDIVGDSQYEKRAGRSLELAMDDGSKIAFTNEGTVSAELDKKGLFLQEMNNMLKEGFMSTIKLSDKKTTLGIRVKGGIIGDKSIRTYTDPYLYIDTDMFKPIPGQTSTLGERYAVNNILLQHFAAEFDRIKRVKENREAVSKIKGPNRIVGKDENGNDLMAAEVFTAFDNILRKNTQKLIYDILPNVEGDVINYLEANNSDLLKLIKNDIASYFRQQVIQNDTLFASKGFFVDEELESKTGIEALTKDKNLTEAEKATRDTLIKRALLNSYTYNAWIHNFEVTNLFIGDLYQFKGEDLHKRDSGSTSGGRGFADSKTIQKFINDHFNKGVYDADTGALIKPKTYAETLNFNEKTDKYDNFVFNGKLRTGVIADAVRESVFLKEMIESWEEEYLTRGESPARAKELALKDAEPYTKMTESDGAAFVTIDAYRTLKKLENAWSDAQETLYQKVINGESLSVKDVKQFFPIYKLQHYGPLHDTVIPVVGMHKYAVSPIIPNAEGQSERNKLQKEMLKKNIQYVVFGSGSKVSSLTADGDFDNVFADETQKSVKAGDDLVITPNVIYTRYLKNVTNVNDKYKKKVVDSTQQRVVITDGLYKEGSIKNPLHKELLTQYNESVKNYTNTAIAEILNNIGFVFKDRKYVANKNSLEKFVEVIKRELGQKAVPEHLVKLLGVTLSGATSMDYSIHPEASTIEKIAAQIIQKRVINQKVKGEPLIQAPTTLTNGIWDQEFEAITDPEERRKVLGSNNLSFYRRGKYDPKTKTYGPTHLAKAAIAMQSDFRYLYELKDLEGNPIKESADPLATLNALIKKDEWLDKDDNRVSITLMGPRIPNDSHNTIEGLEVWHFLDPSFGNTIIVPTEIVAKAGADFDVDKLTLAFPTLSSDGKYIKDPLSNKEFKEQLTLAQENQDKPRDKRNPNLPSVEALIKRQMAALSNLSMKSRIDILKLPENFARLTRPNETHLVDRYAENIASKKEYNKLARMHQEEDDAVVSPTRGLEIAYNLDKHEVNTGGGSIAVGIFAKNNKLHILNKQIGTELPKKYRSTRYVEGKREPGFELYDMVLRFPHNTKLNEKDEEVISMSGETTQKGTTISDINSHNLQGVLDRAKKSFPADLNITPENINMINTLINAGVDEELVFNFVNQPLIIEYIRNIQNMSGIYGKITGVAPKSKSFIRSKAIALVFEQLQKRNKGIETVISSTVETANRMAFDNVMSLDKTINDLKSSTPVAIPLDKDETKFFKTTVGKLKKDVNADKVKFENIYKVYKIEDGRVTDEVLFQKSSSPVSESIYYHVANLVNNKYGQEEYTLEDIKKLFKDQDNLSPQALALFLHYIQLEKALRGHETSQMLLSPDTSNVKTVNQARSTQKSIDELIESETVDPELFNKFNEKAIISSFRVTDLIIDTISTLLPLRLNETISNAIDDYHTTMTSKFPGKDGKELYSTIFNDAVINYIYQNNMSNLLDENGQVIDYPNSYKGIDVEQSTSSNKAVTIKGKKIIINPEIIDNEFTKGYYLDTIGKNNDPESYMSQGYYAFASDKDPFRRRIKEALPLSFKSNYVNFIIQRELLRLTTPIEKLENDVMYLSLYEKLGDKAYEAYLAKRALMNSFNPNYILGKAEFTYTEDVLEAMSMVDPNTKYQIPLLGVLSEQSQIQTEDKILQLNDTLDESSAQAYYRDIVILGDITIRKSDDPDVNKFITDIFKNFSLYMFYQHGVGYSRLGFSKALDASSFTLLMKDAAATFLENIDDNETFLPQIYLEIKNVDNFRNYNAYDNRYDTVSEEVVNANIEEDDDSITDAFLRTAFGDDISEDSPVANVITRLQEIETTNPYRAKDIDMFKQSTAFIGFETTANDPVLESKSSTKVYREAFVELANKGKYTPTDIVALSGSGNFGRKGQLGIVDLTPFIDQDFKTKYAPEIDRAIEDGVRTFLLGTYNDPRNKQDYNIQKYLESKGYVAQTVQSGSYKHYRFTLGEQSTQPSTGVTLKAVASIPQNLVSGIEAFGTKQEANVEAKKLLGNSPHSIDMVEAGLRTRTTRSVGEMDKYNVKVGDIIKQFGKSADGTTKNILTRVTAIHPKGTPGFLGTWNKEGWTQGGIKAIERYKDGAAAIEFEVIQLSTQPTVQPTGEPVSNTNKPKGEEVVPGIYVNQAALTKEEQLELFNYLKPYLEEQAAKTNKGSQASKMIGLGLRWDYKSNNLGKDALIIPDVINPGNRNKYGYYNVSINYQPLGQITPRFRELMQKATGVDMTDYDGAIINLYEKDTFISAHNDVDESKSAIKYPVIGINLGGKGNFSIERIPGAGQLNLEAGTAYVFGVDGVNREVWHRTFPTPQDSFLPELTTKIDGKTYPAGSYRITITMRRVKSIRPGMPTAPSIVSTQPADTRDLTSISETIENLKAREAELIVQKEEVLDNVFEAVVVDNLPRITPESAKKETGLKTGTTKDINPAWLSKDGVTIEEAAHRIWEDFYFESNYDTQDVRNVIIDVLSSAKSKKSYLDNITGQTEINQIRKDIRELQQQLIAPTTIESDISNNLNQPEGLPAIRRSSPNCG